MMKKVTLLCCLFTAVILLGHGNLFSMDRIPKKLESPAEYYHRKMEELKNKCEEEFIKQLKKTKEKKKS